MKIPLSHAALVPVAASQGFEYHHAEPGYVMMTRWLSSSANKLPANASHQVSGRKLCMQLQLGQSSSVVLRG